MTWQYDLGHSLDHYQRQAIESERADFLRVLTEVVPSCTWCGDIGFKRMTDDVVLCVSDFEYVELHRGLGAW